MTEYRTKRRFMDTILSRLPGVTEDAVELELKNALNELFTESNCWRAKIFQSIDIVSQSYELESPDVTSKILYILYGSNQGGPLRYTVIQPRTIILASLPQESVTDAIELIVSLTLDDEICETPGCDSFIPDFVYDYFFETVLDGTLGRLYGTTRKPYSSEKMAVYHLKRFQAGIAKAEEIANAHYTRGYTSWRFPRTFVGASTQRSSPRFNSP